MAEFVEKELQGAMCQRVDCGKKLDKNSASFSRGADTINRPLIDDRSCRQCQNRSIKYSIKVMVDWWARVVIKNHPDAYKTLEEAEMAFMTVALQGYCVGTPDYSKSEYLHLLHTASDATPQCFWCNAYTHHIRSIDAHDRLSIDRTSFKDGKALAYGHPDQILVASCMRCNR